MRCLNEIRPGFYWLFIRTGCSGFRTSCPILLRVASIGRRLSLFCGITYYSYRDLRSRSDLFYLFPSRTLGLTLHPGAMPLYSSSHPFPKLTLALDLFLLLAPFSAAPCLLAVIAAAFSGRALPLAATLGLASSAGSRCPLRWPACAARVRRRPSASPRPVRLPPRVVHALARFSAVRRPSFRSIARSSSAGHDPPLSAPAHPSGEPDAPSSGTS